ncbi:MAG: Rrf2 family transcriptional regulator [Chloroflexi bacterium]|nr:Rrf2 family transcriptional regulator [Chloroflexota bacterium]
MKVSMKVDYGLRALVDLAQHYGQGPIQSKDIARRQGIPEPYLEHVLTHLRRAGFIASRRGPHGGHFLARLPGGIRLDEVINILEGSTAPISCVDKASKCSQFATCVTREVWQAVAEATRGVLGATTVQELASRQTITEASHKVVRGRMAMTVLPDSGERYLSLAP